MGTNSDDEKVEQLECVEVEPCPEPQTQVGLDVDVKPLFKVIKGSKKLKDQVSKDELILPVEQERWAYRFNKLWQWKQADFDAEVDYNVESSREYPHCSICALLTTENEEKDASSLNSPKKCKKLSSSTMPRKCKPRVPNICFSYDLPSMDKPSYKVKGSSHLLVCSECRVCVHARCYGVSEVAHEDWKCQRCEISDKAATCDLCRLRGGALKATTCGKWAHITCAIVVPDVTFTHPHTRDSVNILDVAKSRSKLKCSYCYAGRCVGVCVPCSVAKCRATFHVTCALAAGAVITLQTQPYPLDIECHKCHEAWLMKQTAATQRSVASASHTNELSVGDMVVARHKRNLRYYYVPIVGTHYVTFYSVDFDDGSFSTNLYPQDIVSRDCVSLGAPRKGEHVEVLWTDGETYSGTFKAATQHLMYTVKFDDNALSSFHRDSIWHESETLPKHVSTKISVATERKYDLFYCQVVEGARKRKKKSRFGMDE